MTVILLVFYILADTAALSWGYRSAGFMAASTWCLVFGALWLIATWRKIAWAATVGLFATVVAAGLGVLLGLSLGWMLAGNVFGLIAWDLNRFRERLSLEYFEADLGGIERRHLLRISLLCAVVLGMVSITLFRSTVFSIEWLFLLTLIIMVAIIQFIRWYRSVN